MKSLSPFNKPTSRRLKATISSLQSLLQTEQPQPFSTCLHREVLQPSNNFLGPPQDPSAGCHTQVGCHKRSITFLNLLVTVLLLHARKLFLICKCTLPTHVQFCTHQYPKSSSQGCSFITQLEDLD